MDPKELAKNIADTTAAEMQTKFMKGQAEHGGDLRDRPMIKDIREEVIDLAHYSLILQMHQQGILEDLNTLHKTISNATGDPDYHLLAQVEHIIKKVENL